MGPIGIFLCNFRSFGIKRWTLVDKILKLFAIGFISPQLQTA
jgi:hypothetical protein